ncbi:MAG: Cof-type HAD-IIB family hydrolase [Lachnospiraceae bacterium]|nr:Cof-type HAD-IIB family hydrolase [Lachnospiraceae bacterium]
MPKALFFDIDGTLWDFKNYIPDSTREAIRLLKANGHLVFICSGRCRAYIQNPDLLGLGFDGIVSGCGTMVEYQGRRLFHKTIPADLAVRTVETVRRYGFRPILEGADHLYLDRHEFGQDAYGEKVIREMGSRLLPITELWGQWEISKLSCATNGADRESCFARLKEEYDYIIHNENVVEMVPKGFHKGTGILKVCEILGIDPADTFAFGDSVNDLGMFSTAGISVAMGNGSEAAKAAATYVTSPLPEDGIYNACWHFGLI